MPGTVGDWKEGCLRLERTVVTLHSEVEEAVSEVTGLRSLGTGSNARVRDPVCYVPTLPPDLIPE